MNLDNQHPYILSSNWPSKSILKGNNDNNNNTYSNNNKADSMLDLGLAYLRLFCQLILLSLTKHRFW